MPTSVCCDEVEVVQVDEDVCVAVTESQVNIQ
jgi:hypothetical protein